MGCWSETCVISHLPINAGEKVRYILLQASPFSNCGKDANANTRWYMRDFPIKAEYNDYGSVENVNKEDDFIYQHWLNGLKVDLIEKGVGDNSYHDIAVSSQMSFSDLLEVLVQKRLEVHSRVMFRKSNKPSDRLNTIKKYLDDLPESKYYLLDETRINEFRIRFDVYEKEKQQTALELIKSKLEENDYAVMFTVGSGHYAKNMELMVRPKPGSEHRVYDFDPKNSVMVDHAMIREDVWQLLLSIPMPADYGNKNQTISDYKVLELNKASYNELIDASYLIRGLTDNPTNPLACFVGRNPSISGFGPDNSFMQFMKSEYSEKEVELFLDNLAETAYVNEILFDLRIPLHPLGHHGPQIGEFESHVTYFEKLSNLTSCLKQERDRDCYEPDQCEFDFGSY